MKLGNALRIMLAMTGRYDTARKLTIQGRDMYGQPVEETCPELDWSALDAEAERIENVLRAQQAAP